MTRPANKLIEQFPDATKKSREMKVSYLGPDCPSFTKRFFRNLWTILLLTFVAVVGLIVGLILLGVMQFVEHKRYDV